MGGKRGPAFARASASFRLRQGFGGQVGGPAQRGRHRRPLCLVGVTRLRSLRELRRGRLDSNQRPLDPQWTSGPTPNLLPLGIFASVSAFANVRIRSHEWLSFRGIRGHLRSMSASFATEKLRATPPSCVSIARPLATRCRASESSGNNLVLAPRTLRFSCCSNGGAKTLQAGGSPCGGSAPRAGACFAAAQMRVRYPRLQRVATTAADLSPQELSTPAHILTLGLLLAPVCIWALR